MTHLDWQNRLPNGWTTAPLRAVAVYVVSNVDKVAADGEVSVRLCNYSDVYNNERITLALDLMRTTATENEIAKFGLEVGDVVITKDSESWDDIGVPALVTETAPDLVCGYHLAILRPRASKLYGPYLFRCLQANALRVQLELAATGVTRFGIRQSDIGAMLLPVPPVEEQRAIAEFLDTETARLDALVKAKRRLLELLAEKRRALVTRAVTRGLDEGVTMRDSGVLWLGEVPAHWECGNIRRFAAMKTGHTPDRKNPDYWRDCNIPWFSLADVWQLRDERELYMRETKEQISDLGLANSAAELLPVGTVGFSRTASIGFSGIMPQPMATTQDFWNWVPTGRLMSEYLLYAFRAMQPVFDQLAFGSTHRTIYQSDAADLQICVPPLNQQRAIVAHIAAETAKLDALRAATERTLALLRERRAALITAAVSGALAPSPM